MASVAKSVRRVACSGWKAGVTVSRVRLQYGGSRTRVGFGVAGGGGGGTSRLLMQAGRRLQSTNSSAATSDARGLGLGGKLFFGSLVSGSGSGMGVEWSDESLYTMLTRCDCMVAGGWHTWRRLMAAFQVPVEGWPH